MPRPRNTQIWEVDPDGWYPEPQWTSVRLFEAESFGPKGAEVHDPGCGFGRIPHAAASAGYTASGSDIADRRHAIYGHDDFRFFINDFLKTPSAIGSPYSCVFNSPYSGDFIQQFVEAALRIVRYKVAALVPLRRLSAAHWLASLPLETIYFLTPRPSLPPGKYILERQHARRWWPGFLLARSQHPSIDQKTTRRVAASRRGDPWRPRRRLQRERRLTGWRKAMNSSNAIDRQHHGLDALRIQAELETAERTDSKRPTWAPAVVLEGELLELCRELEFLAPDDKPVARLWAIFADPTKKGTAVRVTYSQVALPGIRCRGFEVHAGIVRKGNQLLMSKAMMNDVGTWSVGHIWWPHSNVRQLQETVYHRQGRLEQVRGRLQPGEPPEPGWTPEEAYQHAIKCRSSEEDAQRVAETTQQRQAEELAKWKEREQKKQDPTFIAEVRQREAEAHAALDKALHLLAKEGATPDWRFKALTRMSQLAEVRLFAFVRDPHVERQRGAAVTLRCGICGRELTDKISVERGIGPECIKWLRPFNLAELVRLKQAMVAAHPDKGSEKQAFIEAYARYEKAKKAAERSSFTY
jgi:hypothetical protein